MENLKKVIECLAGLINLHQERISGYQKVLGTLDSHDKYYLTTLFTAFIKQSEGMKTELRRAANDYSISIRLVSSDGVGLVWSVVKTVFNSRMPTHPLDKCRSGENALLIAYHGIEGSEGLDEKIRELVKKQKREIIAARDWITHFESLAPPKRPKDDKQLAFAAS